MTAHGGRQILVWLLLLRTRIEFCRRRRCRTCVSSFLRSSRRERGRIAARRLGLAYFFANAFQVGQRRLGAMTCAKALGKGGDVRSGGGKHLDGINRYATKRHVE